MSEGPVKPRRWFRWKLSTLFVVLTVLCVWLGYQVNWIRQRQLITRQDGMGVDVLQFGDDAPWPIRYFGEPGYECIILVHRDSKRCRLPSGSGPGTEEAEQLLSPSERAELDRVRKLFPESDVYVPFRPE